MPTHTHPETPGLALHQDLHPHGQADHHPAFPAEPSGSSFWKVTGYSSDVVKCSIVKGGTALDLSHFARPRGTWRSADDSREKSQLLLPNRLQPILFLPQGRSQELSELQAPSPRSPGLVSDLDCVRAPPSHHEGLWPGSGLSKTKSHDTSSEKQNRAQVNRYFCPDSGRHR